MLIFQDFSYSQSSAKGRRKRLHKGEYKVGHPFIGCTNDSGVESGKCICFSGYVFVGKLGQNAIAVVGYTESMITMVYSLSIGLSTAATAIIARRVGEKEMSGASKAAIQALLISLFVSAIISFFGVIYAEKMLAFMGATPEVIAEGLAFTKIMFGFNIVIVLLFLINGIFRGAGNAALAMKSLWIASIFNIILDPLLIYGFGSWQGWGLEGAAIATCIGRVYRVVYQLYHLFYGSGLIK